MPDRFPRDERPGDWHEAFAALPLEAPAPGGWNAITARLDARRRRWLPWTAAAAVLLLALALPWRLHPPAPDGARVPAVAGDPAAAPPARTDADEAALRALYAESAQLEALLPLVRDERVSSAIAAAVTGALASRLTLIDAALAQPGLDHEREVALWRERVDTLHALAGLEGTRLWLAAHGGRYEPALVQID